MKDKKSVPPNARRPNAKQDLQSRFGSQTASARVDESKDTLNAAASHWDTWDADRAGVSTQKETPPLLSAAAGDPNASVSQVPGSGKSEADIRKKQAKVKISSLEQYLEYAYSLKGRKVPLKSKVESAIARDPRLTDEARLKLMELAKKDILLAVPRQLLLSAKDVSGFPGLSGAIRDFVRDVLTRHPLFQREEVEVALRNLEEARPPAEILRLLTTSDKALIPAISGVPLKSADFEQLRVNATYCMAVWLTEVKGLSFSTLVDALYKAVWAPTAQRVVDEKSKLRAITEIAHLAGVGLVTDEYRRVAVERLEALEIARRQAASAIEANESLQRLVDAALAAQTRAERALKSEEARHKEEVSGIKMQADTESAHLRDDLEQLRTRVLRRLKGDLTLLETGLDAIRGTNPKLHVITDHVERVSDSLRDEVKKLQGD